MNNQRQAVLALLQKAGEIGINSYALTYTYGFKQAPTRVKELRDLGHIILSQTLPNKSVQYILVKELPPLQVTTRVKKKKYTTILPDLNQMYYDKEGNIWRYK